MQAAVQTNRIKQTVRPDLVVFPLTKNLFDVFGGDGWTQHARIRRSNTRYYRIGGTLNLTQEELAALITEHGDKQ